MAADPASDFAFLTAAARRALNDLRDVSARSSTSTGGRGSGFLNVVELNLDAVADALAAREAEFVNAQDRLDQESVLRATILLNHELMELHAATPWIESTRAHGLSLGLISFVDELAAKLLPSSGDVDVVLVPTPTYMYSMIHRPFAPGLANHQVQYPAGVLPIIVAFPQREQDSLLLHLIIAHELAHSAVAEANLANDVLANDPDRAATSALLQAAMQDFSTVHGVPTSAAVAAIRSRLYSWLTELMCDALATKLLGPSFLLTSIAFGAPFGPMDSSDTHPPSALRTRLLLNQLDSDGWRPILDACLPTTHSWMAAGASVPLSPTTPAYFKHLVDVMERLRDVIPARAESHLGAETFQAAGFSTVGVELRELLSSGVLPAQMLDGSPVARPCIILAGWLRQFAMHGDDPRTLIAATTEGDNQRFLAKALEMSVVLETWNQL